MIGVAVRPFLSDGGRRGPRVERMRANGHVLLPNSGGAESIWPVIKVMNLDPPAGRDLGGSFAGCGKGVNQKLAVVCDQPMRALASSRDPGIVRLAGALAERRVLQGVVDFVRILGQAAVQFLERPDGLLLGVYRLSYLACQTHDLSVPLKVVNELGISCLE